MNVDNDLSLHPELLVWMLNCTCPVTIDIEAVTGEVSPISTVEKSVYVVVVPFQAAITSPALVFEPFAAVYLKNAEV